MSADVHKYGYASKGVSVILYRAHELARKQLFVTTDWLGGFYASTAMAGTRPAGPIAAAWAALMHIGHDGVPRARPAPRTTPRASCGRGSSRSPASRCVVTPRPRSWRSAPPTPRPSTSSPWANAWRTKGGTWTGRTARTRCMPPCTPGAPPRCPHWWTTAPGGGRRRVAAHGAARHDVRSERLAGLHGQFVDVAPDPVLAGLEGLDERVPRPWKCLVACLLGDESQQLTSPHDRHRRRCTQVPPIFMHSPHPVGVCGSTSSIWSRWVHSARPWILLLSSLRSGHSAVDREDGAGQARRCRVYRARRSTRRAPPGSRSRCTS